MKAAAIRFDSRPMDKDIPPLGRNFFAVKRAGLPAFFLAPLPVPLSALFRSYRSDDWCVNMRSTHTLRPASLRLGGKGRASPLVIFDATEHEGMLRFRIRLPANNVM